MNTIEQQLIELNDIKNAIKEAIIIKGGDISDSDSFSSYASKIRAL